MIREISRRQPALNIPAHAAHELRLCSLLSNPLGAWLQGWHHLSRGRPRPNYGNRLFFEVLSFLFVAR